MCVAGPLAAAELPMSSVVLSSAGLAQFTHSGNVKPGDKIDIPVRLDQVDDLLKSLTIFDEQGGAGPVSLPGQQPMSELFRDLPFGPEALVSRPALLNALVGAEVEIDGPEKAKGRILRVEPEKHDLPNGGGTVQRNRLSLMTDRGLVQAVLEDVGSLRFTDPQTRAQIKKALAGYAENRAKDRRRVSIEFLGRDQRKAELSYVVSAPVWKTSYRLVLPSKPGPARIQGWAVLENMTGGDWKNVDLTLVSGNPVALKQRLYQPQFKVRPEIPVGTGTSLVPKLDDSTGVPSLVTNSDRRREERRIEAMREEQRAERMRQERLAEARRSDRLMEERKMERAREGVRYGAAASPVPPPMAHVAAVPVAEEAVSQIIYRFPEKVSLATGHTMMVPFEDRELAAEQIALYQPQTDPRHPLSAVRLKNAGDSDIPAGLVTTFRTGANGNADFVGDAQLPLLPKGAAKFVTFALDGKTDIRREDGGERQVVTATASGGVLKRSVRKRRTISYEITPTDEDRTVVLEEQRADGWSPVGDASGIEQTPTELRKTVKAPKGKTTKVSLVLEHVDKQDVRLADLSFSRMLGFFTDLQNEAPALKDLISKLSDAVNKAANAERQLGRLADRKSELTADETRIRENLRAVGPAGEQGRTYQAQLAETDQKLATIAKDQEKLRSEREQAQAFASDLVRHVSF
jgi:hypothetical protein